MILSFFRHGPAVPSGTTGVSESERALTPQGIKKTRRAARGVRALDLGIDAIYCSPLIRALKTAEILADELGLPSPHVDDRLAPEVPPEKLLDLLKDVGSEAPVLVGHEPSLSAAVAHLLSASASSIEMKKAGLAVVRLDRGAPRPSGTLLLLAKPSMLRELGA